MREQPSRDEWMRILEIAASGGMEDRDLLRERAYMLAEAFSDLLNGEGRTLSFTGTVIKVENPATRSDPSSDRYGEPIPNLARVTIKPDQGRLIESLWCDRRTQQDLIAQAEQLVGLKVRYFKVSRNAHSYLSRIMPLDSSGAPAGAPEQPEARSDRTGGSRAPAGAPGDAERGRAGSDVGGPPSRTTEAAEAEASGAPGTTERSRIRPWSKRMLVAWAGELGMDVDDVAELAKKRFGKVGSDDLGALWLACLEEAGLDPSASADIAVQHPPAPPEVGAALGAFGVDMATLRQWWPWPGPLGAGEVVEHWADVVAWVSGEQPVSSDDVASLVRAEVAKGRKVVDVLREQISRTSASRSA